MTDTIPPLYQLLLWLGKPLGYFYVPENHARLIRKMDYERLCLGPGFHRYSRISEALAEQVKTGLDAFVYHFDNLPTSDGLQLGLRIQINYYYAPEKIDVSTVGKLAKLSADVMRDIVANRARRALLGVLPAYSADDVCRGTLFENIEQQLMANGNTLLNVLGVDLSTPMVLQVIPPDSLRARYEGVAQRRVQVAAIREHRSTDMSRALAAELIEGVVAHGAGDGLVSMTDVLNVYDPTEAITLPSATPPTAPPPNSPPERRTFLSPPRKRQ